MQSITVITCIATIGGLLGLWVGLSAVRIIIIKEILRNSKYHNEFHLGDSGENYRAVRQVLFGPRLPQLAPREIGNVCSAGRKEISLAIMGAYGTIRIDD